MGVKVREKIKGSGEYYVFIHHNSFRKSMKIGKDKRLAHEVAEKIKAKLVLGQLDIEKKKPQAPTFEKYAKQWLALPHDFKDSTSKIYARNLRLHVYPVIGCTAMDEIDKPTMQRLFDALATDGLARSTIGGIRASISEVLKHAQRAEIIGENSALGLSITGRKAKQPPDPLTDVEIDTLLEQARLYRDGEFYLLFLTGLRTGMRIGEMTALKWQDVDFSNRLIEVQRSLVRGVISSTKNHKRRRVDISPQLAEELKLWRTRQKRQALKFQHDVPKFIFTDTSGKIYEHYQVRAALMGCLKAAGLRQIRIHDLRHTYASIRLLRGHNIGDVCHQLGHSSIKITYDVYGHWVPGRFKSEIDDLDNPRQNAPQARLNESEF